MKKFYDCQAAVNRVNEKSWSILIDIWDLPILKPDGTEANWCFFIFILNI